LDLLTACTSSSSRNRTTNATEDDTNDNDDDKQQQHVLSLLLFHGSWNGIDAARCLQYLEYIFTSYIAILDIDMTNTVVKILSLEVDQDDDGLDLCVDQYRAPAEMPSLRVLYSDSGRDGGGGGSSLREHDVKVTANQISSSLSSANNPSKGKSSSFAQLAINRDKERVGAAILNALESLSMIEMDEEEDEGDCKGKGLSTPLNPSSDKHTDMNIDTNTTDTTTPNTTPPITKGPIRIFVAGDRTQVGKSSICLGLLGTLLHKLNHSPETLAYIKPATQCEDSMLVTQYCQSVGIDTVSSKDAPLVYYKGFTRAFLKGETDGSEVLLRKVSKAVDDLFLGSGDDIVGKKVVIIDGVGYPAVGSITGTDNADIARACGYPLDDNNENETNNSSNRRPPGVLLVGRSGVGDAIDSYNLNASYFKAKDVPVIGVVFNRLSSEGYYALEKCRAPITSYFKQQTRNDQVFGFIPEVEAISNKSNTATTTTTKNEEGAIVVEPSSELAMQNAHAFIDVFSSCVDVSGILKSAAGIKMGTWLSDTSSAFPMLSPTQWKMSTSSRNMAFRTPPPVKSEGTNTTTTTGDSTKAATATAQDDKQPSLDPVVLASSVKEETTEEIINFLKPSVLPLEYCMEATTDQEEVQELGIVGDIDNIIDSRTSSMPVVENHSEVLPLEHKVSSSAPPPSSAIPTPSPSPMQIDKGSVADDNAVLVEVGATSHLLSSLLPQLSPPKTMEAEGNKAITAPVTMELGHEKITAQALTELAMQTNFHPPSGGNPAITPLANDISSGVSDPSSQSPAVAAQPEQIPQLLSKKRKLGANVVMMDDGSENASDLQQEQLQQSRKEVKVHIKSRQEIEQQAKEQGASGS